MRKIVARILKVSLLAVVVVLGLTILCQRIFIFQPRPYPAGMVEAWSREPGTKVIDCQTADGLQHAYLWSGTDHPAHLWIFCGGSGSVSLEWAGWLRDHGPKGDAWLMVDIPGYGASAGSPSADSIRRSVAVVIPAAVKALHWSLPEDRTRLRFFGHSIGAAVCLIAAQEMDIRQGVLLTPFTSTMDMAAVFTRLPLGFAVRYRLDNLARLREIEARGNGRVMILHGTEDETIPIRMARELAAACPHTVHLTEIPGGHHNNLPGCAGSEIEKALNAVSHSR